jgi:hypothetical protein
MRALFPTLLALALAGCPRGARPTEEDAVDVQDVRLQFGQGERGELELELTVRNPALQAGALTAVEWELWLGNRWFAAGTHAVAEPAPKGRAHTFSVRAPLSFRRTQPGNPEPVPVDVGVRGAVTLRSPGGTGRLPFEATRQMRVRHLPVVGAGADVDE